jgi:hypothetical protein
MFIRSPHRSKVFIGLSMFCVVMFIALSVMRVGNTEAQQSVGGFLPPPLLPPQIQTSAPQQQPRTFPTANDGFGLPPGVYTQFAAPPNGVYSNNLANVLPGAMPTAAPMTESDRRALELANRIRQTRDNDEREQLRKQLRETLNAAFDQRREQQLQEIAELERQLDSIRKLDETRQQRKEEIVQRRMSDLLSEPDALDWEPKRLQGQYGFPRSTIAPQYYLPALELPVAASTPRVPGVLPRGQNQDSNLNFPLQSPSRSTIIVSNLGEKPDAKSLPQHAIDGFIYQLTESIMDNAERLRRQREEEKDLSGLSDKQRVNLSASEARMLSSIENGRSIWRRIGDEKGREVESAQRNLKLAERRLEIKSTQFEQGITSEVEWLNEKAFFEHLNDEFEQVKGRLAAWKELDKQVREALTKAGLSDAESDAADAVDKSDDTDAKNKQGAIRSKLLYEVQFSCRVTFWQTMASKA